MPRLGVAICAAAALLAAEALAQEAPPRYRPACASCPAPALTLEAFVAHTRASSDSNLAQELVTAHTRAERIASVGIFAGVAIAAGGVFLVPMRCEPVLSLHANYSPCDLRRRNLALITAGTTVALMGAAYVALVQPREEELLARVNAWNRVHPDAPFRLPAKPTPRADGPGDAASATDETPKPIHPNDA
ncbi:MAG TPA: hypothetical protein VE549_16830, partial [Myxococcaceae bacterium]|nr:hypothetical protein [Myxococcaceae bacterium]